MSKYSHFEMCEKIFGQKYKWNEQKYDYEPYSRTDMWNKMIEQQDKISDLKAKLAESEKSKESYRLQNEHHHLQLLQFYSRLGVEAFGADIHEKALETLMIMKEELEEKKGLERTLSACSHQNDEVADMIKKLVNEKEQLKQQLEEKEKEIESYKHFKITIGTMENNQVDISSTTYTDQDKISFAVEQLKKVKENAWQSATDISCLLDYTELDKIIDNQINELKGKVETILTHQHEEKGE